MRLLPSLLSCSFALNSSTVPTRLVKSILPVLTTLLPRKSEVQQHLQETSTTASKRGKKRARGYEGDEVFKVGVGVLCPTLEDSEIVELALEGKCSFNVTTLSDGLDR